MLPVVAFRYLDTRKKVTTLWLPNTRSTAQTSDTFVRGVRTDALIVQETKTQCLERLFGVRLFFQVLFEDIKGIPVMVLHADRTENRTHGTCCTALFPNDFPDVPGGDAQPQYCAFFSFNGFNIYRIWVIHQSLSYLGD
jgi:hypothetical protein